MRITTLALPFFLLFVKSTELAGVHASFTDKYCIVEAKILDCDYTFHRQARTMAKKYDERNSDNMLLTTVNHPDVGEIHVRNFPDLTIGETGCNIINIHKSTVTFTESTDGSCPDKMIDLRSSRIDRLPREVTSVVAFASHIGVLQGNQLRSLDVYNSEIESVEGLIAVNTKVDVLDSIIRFASAFSIEKSSVVKFVNSQVTFTKGGFIVVEGDLTLQSTQVDARYIDIRPSATFLIKSPKSSIIYYSNEKQDGSDCKKEDISATLQKLLADPSPNAVFITQLITPLGCWSTFTWWEGSGGMI